jgi:hypothetical protein
MEAIRAETWKAIKEVDLDKTVVETSSKADINLDVKNKLDAECKLDVETKLDVESKLDLADNVNLNKSNNHNNSTDSSESDNFNQDGGQDPEELMPGASPHRLCAFDLISTSHYPGTVSSSLHGSSGSLPRISQSNGVSWSESYLESYMSGEMSMPLSKENTEDSVKLPNISSKSFLVHTQQGMNKCKDKDRKMESTRDQLQIVSNDISDTKGDNASGDKEVSKAQSSGSNYSGKMMSSFQIRPHKNRQSKDY